MTFSAWMLLKSLQAEKKPSDCGIERKQKSIFVFKRGVEIELNADEVRLANVKEVKEMTDLTDLKESNVIRTMAKIPTGDPESEWTALKAFCEAMGLAPTEEDKGYFLAKLAEQKK